MKCVVLLQAACKLPHQRRRRLPRPAPAALPGAAAAAAELAAGQCSADRMTPRTATGTTWAEVVPASTCFKTVLVGAAGRFDALDRRAHAPAAAPAAAAPAGIGKVRPSLRRAQCLRRAAPASRLGELRGRRRQGGMQGALPAL